MSEHIWKVGIFYNDDHDVPLPYAYDGKGEVLSGKEIAHRLNKYAALKEAIDLALPSVEWMAEAVDADPEDHERLAQIRALLKGAGNG